MPFTFSFTFTVPAIPNPFSASSTKLDRIQSPSCAAAKSSLLAPTVTVSGLDTNYPHTQLPLRRDRRAPSPIPPAPLSRKRGWHPSSSEPSYASTVPVSGSGYLDTPAKYRDMAFDGSVTRDCNSPNQDEMEGELPPPKRRRTLAGSIVSTALSAALIGTAVGITVYRLWRDRGQQSETISPPSYQESEWAQQSDSASQQQHNPSSTGITASSSRSRRVRTTTGRRSAVVRHRKTLSRSHTYSPPRSASPPRPTAPPSPFDFRFGQPEENRDLQEPEDEMDWIGDRISKLIEEGKKALGKEIVVMSDAKEDEVDDGSGAWEEESEGHTGHFAQHNGARPPRHVGLLPPYSSHGLFSPPSPARSNPPRGSILPGPSSPFTPRGPSRDPESPTIDTGSWRESEGDWQSLEIKRSMEKARATYLSRSRG